jgi:hypothetical protein
MTKRLVIDCPFINENSENCFSLYPNPASESVVLKTNNSLNGNYVVRITNELGQIVKSETLTITPGSEYNIKLGLPSGIYTISIIDNQSRVTGIQPLIIQ